MTAIPAESQALHHDQRHVIRLGHPAREVEEIGKDAVYNFLGRVLSLVCTEACNPASSKESPSPLHASVMPSVYAIERPLG